MIRLGTVGIALCLVLVVTQAGAQSGNGQVVGHSVLAIKGCGQQRASFSAAIVTAADGTWTGQDSDGQSFTGTWTAKGPSGRKLELAFDPETEAGFVSGLVGDIVERCETPGPITVRSVAKKAFALVVNRKQTRLTLVLRYVVTGSAGGRSGTARYRVKAKGPWTPAGG
jgi:hypothetical protein